MDSRSPTIGVVGANALGIGLVKQEEGDVEVDSYSGVYFDFCFAGFLHF